MATERTFTKAYHDEICKKLVDTGRPIEAGWIGYKMAVLPKDASLVQIEETRKAFFVGAQHLYAVIMSMMGPDREPTTEDLHRMAAVDIELGSFARELRRKSGH